MVAQTDILPFAFSRACEIKAEERDVLRQNIIQKAKGIDPTRRVPMEKNHTRNLGLWRLIGLVETAAKGKSPGIFQPYVRVNNLHVPSLFKQKVFGTQAFIWVIVSLGANHHVAQKVVSRRHAWT
jgi:hypothetical protein